MSIVLLGVVLGFALMALPVPISGDWTWWEAWAFALVIGMGFIASRLLAAHRSPDVVAERTKMIGHSDAKRWDKVLAPVVAFGLAIVAIVAGIEHGWVDTVPFFPPWLRWLAIGLVIGGEVFGSWALVENRFFSSVVRIQSDRGHRVVSSGPYAIVRHPGYLGALVVYLAAPVVLGSVWALPLAVFFSAALVVRTVLEDRTLQAELPGYAEYSRKTPFRLLPGAW